MSNQSLCLEQIGIQLISSISEQTIIRLWNGKDIIQDFGWSSQIKKNKQMCWSIGPQLTFTFLERNGGLCWHGWRGCSWANFHFSNPWDEGHHNVGTMGSDFFPVVQGCKVGFPDDVEFLTHTQFAYFRHWVEGLPPVQDSPAHCACWSPSLAFPDVWTQDCFMPVPFMVERLLMVPQPRFEVVGAADIELYLLLSIQYNECTNDTIDCRVHSKSQIFL